MKLSAPSDKDIILKPIQPNLGVEAAYRKSLKKLLREMRADVQGLLERHYPKGIAQDSLTDGLQAALAALLRYWLARLDKLAPQIAGVNHVIPKSSSTLPSPRRCGGFCCPQPERFHAGG